MALTQHTDHEPAPDHTQRPVLRDGRHTGYVCVVKHGIWVHDISCPIGKTHMERLAQEESAR